MVGEWRVACKGRNQVELPQTATDGEGHGASSPKQARLPSGTSMQVKVVRTGHKASDRSFGRERLCKHKYSNYCVDDVLEQDKDEAAGPRVADEVTTLMVSNLTVELKREKKSNFKCVFGWLHDYLKG